MSRMLVLGAGIVGTAAAWDLVRRGHEVTVADASPSTAQRAAGVAGCEPLVLDVDAADDVAAVLQRTDLVVSAVPYHFGLRLAEAAIGSGVHYVDFGGNPDVVRAQIGLDAMALSRGVVVVPDCGLAPGLANVLAEDLIDSLGPGPVDTVQLRVGALPQTPVGALGYQLAFSPAGLINEYAELCDVLDDGVRTTVEPLSHLETVEWEGWGPLEAFSTAGGTSTMCLVHEGRVRELEYKTLRYPGHGAVFRAMRELGLFDEEPNADGIAPRSVLVDALAQRLPRGGPDVVLVRVRALRGPTVLSRQLVDVGDERFSALARTTAFPATALADIIMRGEVDAGVRAMHRAIVGSRLLEELAAVGIRLDPPA